MKITLIFMLFSLIISLKLEEKPSVSINQQKEIVQSIFTKHIQSVNQVEQAYKAFIKALPEPTGTATDDVQAMNALCSCQGGIFVLEKLECKCGVKTVSFSDYSVLFNPMKHRSFLYDPFNKRKILYEIYQAKTDYFKQIDKQKEIFKKGVAFLEMASKQGPEDESHTKFKQFLVQSKQKYVSLGQIWDKKIEEAEQICAKLVDSYKL